MAQVTGFTAKISMGNGMQVRQTIIPLHSLKHPHLLDIWDLGKPLKAAVDTGNCEMLPLGVERCFSIFSPVVIYVQGRKRMDTRNSLMPLFAPVLTFLLKSAFFCVCFVDFHFACAAVFSASAVPAK